MRNDDKTYVKIISEGRENPDRGDNYNPYYSKRNDKKDQLPSPGCALGHLRARHRLIARHVASHCHLQAMVAKEALQGFQVDTSHAMSITYAKK